MTYPAVHYAMGGLWVDYNLMSTVPGLFVLGEANFSDHGANRLGASALMQGLADGYFVIPATIGAYLAGLNNRTVDPGSPAFLATQKEAEGRISRLLACKGKRTVDDFHRQLGLLLWNHCGMARNETGLREALQTIPAIREEFRDNVIVPGRGQTLNQSLERAGRVADFLEFAEVMVMDALHRTESCGCHLREESQTPENEALRDDANFAHVAVWEHKGADAPPVLHKEPLSFENVTPSQRSYK
jgi:succinate dehydrogenase / fumarate reductase, flavoprotein subunit